MFEWLCYDSCDVIQSKKRPEKCPYYECHAIAFLINFKRSWDQGWRDIADLDKWRQHPSHVNTACVCLGLRGVFHGEAVFIFRPEEKPEWKSCKISFEPSYDIIRFFTPDVIYRIKIDSIPGPCALALSKKRTTWIERKSCSLTSDFNWKSNLTNVTAILCPRIFAVTRVS